MRILFLTTSSNETDKYIDGLIALKATAHHIIRYDNQMLSDAAMYAQAKEFKPDFCVYIGSRWGKQPSPAMLAQVNSALAPMIHFCSDAADPPWWDLLQQYHYAGAFTLQVAIDGNKEWPLADACMTLLTPVDPADFPNGELRHEKRVIAAGYAGNSGGPGTGRQAILTGLLESELLDIHIRSSLPHTYKIFCRFMQRIRISLNISLSGTESAKQVKGRVIETGLAGACLLELQGSPTSDWFAPGTDYLEYRTIDEAKEIIRALSSQPQTTQHYADNLRRKVLSQHSPKQFWDQILERIGMKQ